jgi:organic radical activating enzyme
MLKKVGTLNYIPTGIELIVSNASKYSETVVVTGGEPLMWI